MTGGLARFNFERLMAAAMSLALLISATGWVYITSRIPITTTHRGFQSAPIDVALLLFIIAETDIPRKMRESPAIRRQVLAWGVWLIILGVAPALDPQAIPPTVTAVVAGLLMSLASVAGLFM